MVTLTGSRNRRLAAAGIVAAAVAATAGVLTAAFTDEHRGPDLARVTSGDAIAAPLGGADAAVEFPAPLDDLANPPTHLVVDPKTGDVWFMIFTYNGVKNVLHHYSPATGLVETFDIPSSTGTELFSAIGVDPRGHVISAEGSVVTDFDPLSGSFKQTPLPDLATPRVNYSPPDGSPILDMAIGAAGVIYFSRMNVPAITELQIGTGKTREIPYPPTFGPAYDIELGSDGLWMTSRWDIMGISSAQTGRIELPAGTFTAVDKGATALASRPGGVVRGIRASSPEAAIADLVELTASGLQTISFESASDKAQAASGLGVFDHMTVDPRTGSIWFTGESNGSIFKLDTRTGSTVKYELPVYRGAILSCPYPKPGYEPAPCNGDLKTRVRGLAVAPNGDVYFSDATRNRIGVIRASQ